MGLYKKGLFMTSASETFSNAQHELEKLVSDLRGLISSKDLDSVPEIRHP